MNSENQIRTLVPQGATFGGWRLWGARTLALLVLVLMCSSGSLAYSVLTHEEIVDLLWTDELSPLLLKRFPTLTEEQLKEAHGYAYGGAVIQDLGYYPFGRPGFHYLVFYGLMRGFVRVSLAKDQRPDEVA